MFLFPAVVSGVIHSFGCCMWLYHKIELFYFDANPVYSSTIQVTLVTSTLYILCRKFAMKNIILMLMKLFNILSRIVTTESVITIGAD